MGLDFLAQPGHLTGMRLLWVMILASLCALTARAEDWTVNGKNYHNVIVGQIEGDRVHITYDGGACALQLSDLSPGLQKKLGYNPAVAAQIRALKDQIAVLVEENAKLRADLARYKGPPTETPDSGTTPVVNDARIGFLYFYNSLSKRTTRWINGKAKDGPFAGMTGVQAQSFAQQQWASMSQDQREAYENGALLYGTDPNPNSPPLKH